MTKQTLVVVLVALVLFAVAIVGALAFTGGSEEDNVHTMPGGETMTGTMPTTTSEMAPLGEAP
jgi:flagellar basal body-associated protein FliL